MQIARIRQKGLERGFTRADLTATLAAAALLSLTMGNSLAKPKTAARGGVCLNNLQQVVRAWQMYTSDNNDRFPGVVHGGEAMSPVPNDARGIWAAGWLTWDRYPGNTNTLYLTDPRYSSLARYLGNRRDVYKCPADTFLSAAQRGLGWLERVRSISASVAVGEGNAEVGPWDGTTYRHVKKTADLNIPSPAETFVFLDENADSMNDPVVFPPLNGNYVDLPGSYHEGAGSLAFADGHAETHAWKTPQARLPVKFINVVPTAKPGSPDIAWLRFHTPRNKD